jgi:hypothetical protein
VAQDGDALDRQARSEGVDGLEVRSEQVEPPELSLGVRDAWVGFVAGRLGRGRWRHDLPGLRRAACRILGDEVMQERRSRPGQADDEERTGNPLVGDAGMTLAILGQAQAVGEQAEQISASHDPAEQREPRLRLQPLEDYAQRRAELVAAEIVEAGLPARRLQERALREADGFEAQTAEAPSGGVRGADDAACGRRHDIHPKYTKVERAHRPHIARCPNGLRGRT